MLKSAEVLKRIRNETEIISTSKVIILNYCVCLCKGWRLGIFINIYRMWTNKSLCVLVDEKKGTLQLFFIAHKFPWSHPIIGALDSTEQKNLKVSQKASQYLQQFPTRELRKFFQFQRAARTAAGSASSNRGWLASLFSGETRYRRISDALPWNRSAKILLFWYFFNRSTWSYRMCPFLFQIISFFILHSPNNVFRPETMCFWHCRALQVGVKIEIVKINIFRLKLWRRQKHVKKWILVHFLVRVFWSCVHEALKEEILNAQLFTSAIRQKSSFQSATRINLA